jgi:hypothetical protein
MRQPQRTATRALLVTTSTVVGRAGDLGVPGRDSISAGHSIGPVPHVADRPFFETAGPASAGDVGTDVTPRQNNYREIESLRDNWRLVSNTLCIRQPNGSTVQ